MRWLSLHGIRCYVILGVLGFTGSSSSGAGRNDTFPHDGDEESSSSRGPPDSAENYTRYLEEHRKFHGNSVCNRTAYNEMKCALNRRLRKRVLRRLVGLSLDKEDDEYFPPAERILECPSGGDDALPDWGVREMGLDTTWLVENTSRQPVLVAYVDYDQDENGREMSPFAPWALAESDPQAILPPGSFRGIQALEGQVFRVRALELQANHEEEEGEHGGTHRASRVLLQYRAGVRELARHYDTHPLGCDPEAPDIKPPRNETGRNRVAPKERLRCHSIETGFRNMSPCPLNAYFVYNNSEDFRYHLGTNHSVDAVMKEVWTSGTKFETTYVPHTYVIRHAVTNEFVQRYTLQPTRIPDCGALVHAEDASQEKWHDQVIILPRGEMAPPPTTGER